MIYERQSPQSDEERQIDRFSRRESEPQRLARIRRKRVSLETRIAIWRAFEIMPHVKEAE